MIPTATVADRLKAKREERGLSQSQLGKLIGKTPAMVSQWECGRRVPCHRQTIADLCKALECSADYLLAIEASRSSDGA